MAIHVRQMTNAQRQGRADGLGRFETGQMAAKPYPPVRTQFHDEPARLRKSHRNEQRGAIHNAIATYNLHHAGDRKGVVMHDDQERYYVRRLMEEHARLIMEDDPQGEETHHARIDFYKGKLHELGVNYDPVASEWVRDSGAAI